MHDTCHRCGEDITPGPTTSYCSHCGAPQIYLRDYSPAEPLLAEESTGAVPPPPMVAGRQVEWRAAIRAGAVVALAGGVLAGLAAAWPMLGLASWLWCVSGSVIALGMYQKQRPLAWMDARIGARVGLLVGLLLSSALGISEAISGLVSRFLLKNMGAVDALNRTVIEQVKVQMAHIFAPDPLPPQFLAMLSSPEYTAGMVLMRYLMVAFFLLAFSAAGGAFAGLMRSPKRA